MDRGRLRHSAITSGEKGSAFYSVAEKYTVILARDGVKLIVLPSAGAVENLQRLTDPMFKVDIGFVQAGLAKEQNIEKLVSSINVSHFNLYGADDHTGDREKRVQRDVKFQGRRLNDQNFRNAKGYTNGQTMRHMSRMLARKKETARDRFLVCQEY